MTPCSLVRPVDFSLPTFVYVCQACLLLPQGCAEPSFIYEVTGEHCCTVSGFIATIPQGAFFLSPPPFFFCCDCVFLHIVHILIRPGTHATSSGTAQDGHCSTDHTQLFDELQLRRCARCASVERELIFTAFSILWRPHVKAGRKKINKSYDFSGEKKK